MSTLIKDLGQTVLEPEVPGTPGSPPTPAYCTTTTTTEYVYPVVYVTQEDGTVVALPGSSYPVTKTKTTCYPSSPGVPPTPGRPSRVAQNFNLGWNGGGRSIDTLPGNGGVEFSVQGGSIGAVVGLHIGAVEFSFAEVLHGLYFRGGVASVVEAGVHKTGAEPFQTSDVFRIERAGSVVRYYKNSELIYTSTQPSYGTQHMEAVLYSGGDAVIDPAFDADLLAGFGSGSATIEAVAARGGDVASAGGIAIIGPVEADGTAITEQGGGALIKPIVAIGGKSYASGTATIASLLATGEAGTAPSFALGVAMSASAMAGGNGTTSHMSLHPMKSLCDSRAAWVNGAFAGMTVHIVAGVGSGQSLQIGANTGQALLFNLAWSIVPGETSQYEVRDEFGTVVASGFVTPFNSDMAPAVSLGSDYPYAGGVAEIQPVTAYGTKLIPLDGYAFVSAPMGQVYALARDSTGDNEARITAPAGTLAAFVGGFARVRAPVGSVSASATTTNWLTANVQAPAGRVTASGTFAETVRANITAPMASLVGYGGMVCSVELAGMPSVSASVTAGSVIKANITGQMARLDLFEVTAEDTCSALITAPMGQMAPVLHAWVMSPMATLTAVGTAIVAATHEAYAVNLLHRGGSTVDEVTHYTNFPFTHVVRYQNSYYGVNSTGLYLLEGTTDDGDPIEWAVQTAMEDFGSPRRKTIDSVYIEGRLGAATTVSLQSGEKTPNTYSHTTPRGATAQNHRQKLGRGVKERYHALGLAGDGEFELDAVEFNERETNRRI